MSKKSKNKKRKADKSKSVPMTEKEKVYEAAKQAEKSIVCDECKHEFLLRSVNISEAPVKVYSEELQLVYFVCPKCNKIYRVLLKDKAYSELKEDLEKVKKRIRKNLGSNNEEFARTLNFMAYKKQERLQNHVLNIHRKYPGTFTFVTSENNGEEQTIKYQISTMRFME